MDVPPEAIEAPLQELIDNFVLDPPGDRTVYDFRHQLLRDAIYRSVPVGDRGGSTPGPLNSAPSSRARPRSIHRCTTSGPGMRSRGIRGRARRARGKRRASPHREVFDLYRRAVEHMPDDLDPRRAREILEAYGVAASSIEENGVWRSSVAPGGDRLSSSRRCRIARSCAMPVSWARCAATAGPSPSASPSDGAGRSSRLPTGTDPSFDANVRADVSIHVMLAHLDAESARRGVVVARDLPRVCRGRRRRRLAEPARVARRRARRPRRQGVAAGSRKVGDAAHMAERAGHEMSGVSAFRDAAVWAARSMDYAGADRFIAEGLRYADQIEQSHCAHVMSATAARWSPGPAGAGSRRPRRRARRSRITAAEGGRTRRAGRSATCSSGAACCTTAAAELDEALEFGEHSETIGLILPPLWGLAEAALLRGDAEVAVAALPGRARPGPSRRRTAAARAVRRDRGPRRARRPVARPTPPRWLRGMHAPSSTTCRRSPGRPWSTGEGSCCSRMVRPASREPRSRRRSAAGTPRAGSGRRHGRGLISRTA